MKCFPCVLLSHERTPAARFPYLELRCAQTPNPVLELEYLQPVNSNGRKLDRSIILHFLSMGEFVDAVLQDDFELGVGVEFFFSSAAKATLCRRIVDALYLRKLAIINVATVYPRCTGCFRRVPRCRRIILPSCYIRQ